RRRRQPSATLFPYTTLFRSWNNRAYQAGRAAFIINQGSVYPYLASEDPELLAKTGLFAMPVGPAGAINHIETWSFGLFRHAPYRSEEHTSELQSRENLVCRL